MRQDQGKDVRQPAAEARGGKLANGPGLGKAPLRGQFLWGSCPFHALRGHLARNRWAVDPRLWRVALHDLTVSLGTSLLGWVQEYAYGPRIDRTPIRDAPVFILGHWRTGTTFLHDLLCLDPRHTYPTTYACFLPNHFLLTERWVSRRWPLSGQRWMDNMELGWDKPQEDEYALLLLGQPSPYLTSMFPNRPPQFQEFLDLEGVPPKAREAWKNALLRFLKAVTLRRPGRLVLKSPTHTARIKVLLELFPDARFVHIIRNPYAVFPSMVKLLRSMYGQFGLHRPTYDGLEEFVFGLFTRLYQRLEEGRQLVPPAHFYEVRYEDLVRNPLAQVQNLYAHLDLGDFESVRPRLEEHLARVADYRPNQHNLRPRVRAEITRRWGDVIRRYGYGETG